VAASFFISMTVQSSFLRKSLDSKDEQLKRAMSGFFGNVSSSAMRTHLSNPNSLKAAIQKELEKTREMATVLAPNTTSPVVLLKNLSKKVGKENSIDLMALTIGAAPRSANQISPVEITIVTSDPLAAEKITQAISPKLIQTTPPTQEEVPATGKEPRKFRITWRGNAAEGAFNRE
ncbi:hypothetical protein EBZ37_14415, partial [bacterium]|nr:hypothetical protein [bacterium]